MTRPVFILLAIFATLLSQPVEISIPDTSATGGATVLIPIRIGSVTGRDIIGVDITLSFRDTVLSAETVWVGNVVPSRWLIMYNANNPGELVIAMAGANPLQGEGSLCTLRFVVRGSAGDTTTIHFSRCQLNEGSVPCATDDGLFTVNAVGIEENEWEKQLSQLKITPNPFANSAEISYKLTQENKINVSIYDALGKKIKTLVDSKQEPGIYTQKWRGTKENGTECKNGIYYLIIEHNNTILKRKLIKI